MRTGIFGAGQAGEMLKRWLPSEKEVVCFIDNNPQKQGDFLDAVPIVSLENALALSLEEIILAILNREAKEEIIKQLKASGFQGEIKDIDSYRRDQDLRLAQLRLLAKEIHERKVEGAVAELGVYQGEFAKEINRCFPDRKLYLFDTFAGFDARDLKKETEVSGQDRFRDFSETTEELVLRKLPRKEMAVLVKGYFPDSLVQMPEERYAFVSLDPDLYLPTKSGLSYFYDRLNPGGVMIIHDYNSAQFPGVKKAVDEFLRERGLFVIPIMDLHGSAVLLKQKICTKGQ